MGQCSIRVVCEFSALFDIEYGIIKVIQEEFNIKHNGEYVFNQYTLNSSNDSIKTLLLTDEDDDLAKLLTTGVEDEDRLNLAQYICNHMCTDSKWYHKAIDKSLRTSICKLAQIWSKSNAAIITVLCKNPLEQQIIKRSYPDFKTIVGDFIDLSSYGVIYIRRFDDILRYQQAGTLSAKEIIVPTYWCNMQFDDRTKPKIAISYIIGTVNKIKTINPYGKFQLPVDEDK